MKYKVNVIICLFFCRTIQNKIMSGRKRKSSSKSATTKSKRRRKSTKRSSTKEAVDIDFRKHVGLLGGLRIEKANDAHSHIKKVQHFVEQRQHTDFFEILPQILSPRFLYYSRIFHKSYDGLILFLWRYCLLGECIIHIMTKPNNYNDSFPFVALNKSFSNLNLT